MTTDLKSYISKLLDKSIIKVTSVSGGDISEAFVIHTEKQKYFIKTNTADKYPMFKAEAKGLQAIANTNTIATPKVYHLGIHNEISFLIMQWVESKQPNHKDFEILGEQLAELHQTTTTSFGLDSDNFIGSLHQSNTKHQNWTPFYIEERLLPQLHLAIRKGLLNSKEVPSISKLETVLQPLFKTIKPSLLHGDLWSGNYLISKDGISYLIDPAVYYGHHEVDIAMTKLFGGFSNTFYESYFDKLPKDTYTNQRIDIYQLYYLLVHLNLFGKSYYNTVIKLLKKHF